MAALSVSEPQEMEVDRRGESEESGDDETKRRSVNGEVGDLQRTSTAPEELPVDMDTITLDPNEEDVDLVHCRIGKIEGLEVLQKAKTLSLRQNLIKNIENLESLVSLKELDLYDNQIRKLGEPAGFNRARAARRIVQPAEEDRRFGASEEAEEALPPAQQDHEHQ
ncbi:hypothetical protein AMELA_G00212510 [Ameiurus melas]|uniref:Uncharacterized protein n=1 Tax=Ameiurus melas TaxID=219545 RepID=A0A7J6A067_AMEME|nr:hypothetical protein AMELA_G00212510 [Ameiurus melas]